MSLILDRPIAFHRCFVTLTGSVTAALFLSQAIYWANRTKHEMGWFYKSREEWTEETGLSRREQETARKRLKDLGLLREKREGFDPTVWFWIDVDRVEAMCLQLSTCTTPEGGNVPQVRVKTDHSCGANRTAVKTEITPEITKENVDAAASTPTREEIRKVTDAYQVEYEKRHGKKPEWSEKDFALVKRQIKRVGDANEIVLVVKAIWSTTEPYWMRIQNSFKSVMSDDTIDQMIPVVREAIPDVDSDEDFDEYQRKQEEQYGR